MIGSSGGQTCNKCTNNNETRRWTANDSLQISYTWVYIYSIDSEKENKLSMNVRSSFLKILIGSVMASRQRRSNEHKRNRKCCI